MSTSGPGGGSGGGRTPVSPPSGLSTTGVTLLLAVGLPVALFLLVGSAAVWSAADISSGLNAVVGGIGAFFAGIFGFGSGLFTWLIVTAPQGSTAIPFVGIPVPNPVWMGLAIVGAVFVTADRFVGFSGGSRIGGVADLSRTGLVIFAVWLVWLRADSFLELAWWFAAAIPVVVFALLAYTYFEERRTRARPSTAMRNTPGPAADRIGSWANFTFQGVAAFVAGLLAVVQVVFGSISIIGAQFLGVASEIVYTVVAWVGYTSIGGDFGSRWIPAFTAEQFVVLAGVLGVVALILRGQSSSP